jgi:hypothetical protein
MKKVIMIIGLGIWVFLLPQMFQGSWKIKIPTIYIQMTEATGKAQLRQLEDVNENLKDIKGLLNSIAENTRK